MEEEEGGRGGGGGGGIVRTVRARNGKNKQINK